MRGSMDSTEPLKLRNPLSRVAAARREGLDCGGVGHLNQQPPGAILQAHQSGPKAIDPRKLAAAIGRVLEPEV